jgi:tetratricopeptide (TPR) repeat protein
MNDIDDKTILNTMAGAPYAISKGLKKLHPEYYDGRLVIYSSKANSKGLHMPVGFHRPPELDSLLLSVKERTTKGTKQKQVKDYMTASQNETILAGGLFADAFQTIDLEDVIKDTIVESPSDSLNAQGEDLYFDGKYAAAIAKFEQAIKKDPKNYIAYSNISLACYKAGEYTRGREAIRSLLYSDHAKDMPDDIKAYSYFNSAMCREAEGDKAKKLSDKAEHYRLAKINYENAAALRKGAYRESIDNISKKLDKVQKDIKAAEKSKANVKNKAKFDNAKAKIPNKKTAPKPRQKSR